MRSIMVLVAQPRARTAALAAIIILMVALAAAAEGRDQVRRYDRLNWNGGELFDVHGIRVRLRTSPGAHPLDLHTGRSQFEYNTASSGSQITPAAPDRSYPTGLR